MISEHHIFESDDVITEIEALEKPLFLTLL